MRFTVLFECGPWIGIGIANGLVPELRIGFVRVAFVRGLISERFCSYAAALRMVQK